MYTHIVWLPPCLLALQACRTDGATGIGAQRPFETKRRPMLDCPTNITPTKIA